MKVRNLVAPIFLVVCLGAAVLVVATRRQASGRPLQGFTLYITQTSYPSSGSTFVTATKVRQQKADGSWKLTTTYSSGRVDVGFGEPGRGVFAIDEKNQKLEYLSSSSARPLADIDWRKEPGFVGVETILGYETFHIHKDGENGDYVDTYMCPELQGYSLRSVNGNALTKTVFEVTRVTLGEPTFERGPDLPVSTERFEQKMKL